MSEKNKPKRQWRKADLHLHTPASADWEEPDITMVDWLQKAEARRLDIVAITDHNTVAGIARLREEIDKLSWLERQNRLRPDEKRTLDEYRRLGNKILILPGFEFTATFGFHVLGIFPPETPVRALEHILLNLNVPPEKLDSGSTEVGATADVLTAYRTIRAAGGIVIAPHANSTHGVAMRDFPFGGQTKIAYTQDPNLHALEVTDLESRSKRATARFYSGSKPEYPRRMHCIQGSDAHRLHRHPNDRHRLGVGDRVTEILMEAVGFDELKAIFEGTDFARTRPYRVKAEPYDHVIAAREQGPSIVQSFHESMAQRGGRLRKILCDVVAFANTNGGTIYVGVSATKKGVPVGVQDPEKSVRDLKAEIQRQVTPPLDVAVDVLDSQGTPVIRVTVPEGKDKPYCIEDNKIFLRQEGETYQAMRDEIVQLAQQSLERKQAERQTTEKEKKKSAQEARKLEAPPSAAANGVEPPKVGVQIVQSDERKGTLYHAIKDLRNGNVVHNVTRKSARKLWNYAITKHETEPVDPNQVQWSGNIGLLHGEKRAGKARYDFVQRMPDGELVVYYGVTEEGVEGAWRQFLDADDTNGQ